MPSISNWTTISTSWTGILRSLPFPETTPSLKRLNHYPQHDKDFLVWLTSFSHTPEMQTSLDHHLLCPWDQYIPCSSGCHLHLPTAYLQPKAFKQFFNIFQVSTCLNASPPSFIGSNEKITASQQHNLNYLYCLYIHQNLMLL